jgi:2-polyprenyl-6-hydroxyphenyl methylase/3-demethylubiquinone-9 3-methyltransferase
MERLEVWKQAIDANVSQESVVADLGCGPGHLTVMAASRARQVIAIDGSAEMIDRARKACSQFRNVECRTGMLEYVADPARVLRQFHDALRPGGVLVLSVPNGDSGYRKLEQASYRLLRRPRYLRYVREIASEKRERERLAEAGFEVTGTKPFSAAPFLPAILGDTLLLMTARRPGAQRDR